MIREMFHSAKFSYCLKICTASDVKFFKSRAEYFLEHCNNALNVKSISEGSAVRKICFTEPKKVVEVFFLKFNSNFRVIRFQTLILCPAKHVICHYIPKCVQQIVYNLLTLC